MAALDSLKTFLSSWQEHMFKDTLIIWLMLGAAEHKQVSAWMKIRSTSCPIIRRTTRSCSAQIDFHCYLFPRRAEMELISTDSPSGRQHSTAAQVTQKKKNDIILSSECFSFYLKSQQSELLSKLRVSIHAVVFLSKHEAHSGWFIHCFCLLIILVLARTLKLLAFS